MQSRTWKYLVACAGLAITAACADDQPASRVTMPTGASALVSSACDFTMMKKDARGYFLSNQDPVYDLMQQLASLNKGSGSDATAAFNQKAFEILSYVGSVAGNSAIVTTATAGDLFVRDVTTCLGLSTTPGQFTGALGPNGLFGVPNGIAALVSRGALKYGVEPTGTNTWAQSIGQQVLLYGNPRNFGFTPETPVTDINSGAYELATLPAISNFLIPIVGGVCVDDPPPTGRLLHEHGVVDEILSPITPKFCLGITSTETGFEGRGALAFVRHVADWFAPKSLHAATAFFGGMGGSLGGLSPIGPVLIVPSTVSLAFIQQPSNGSINQPITPTITVSAVTANGTPLDGVEVTLTVVGNSGSFTLSGNIATTTNGGVASFPNFQTDKAGGYTLVATGTIAGGDTKPSAVSVLFNVNGQ